MQEPGQTQAAQALEHYREVIASRDRLVRAAREEGVSIRRIHNESGISRTTIYRILGEKPTPEDNHLHELMCAPAVQLAATSH